MPLVEVFEVDENAPLFVGEFSFVPRIGETISKDMGGYFAYYDVIEIWHRELPEAGKFQTCVRVTLND